MAIRGAHTEVRSGTYDTYTLREPPRVQMANSCPSTLQLIRSSPAS